MRQSCDLAEVVKGTSGAYGDSMSLIASENRKSLLISDDAVAIVDNSASSAVYMGLGLATRMVSPQAFLLRDQFPRRQ
jgi:hypothetical protein